MNKDIRLDTGFIDHPKTIKLEKQLGFDGIKALLRLWCFAAKNKPSGYLKNMDKEDITLAAKWDGNPDEFIQTLLDLGWLDIMNEIYYLHDWHIHQSYVVHSEARSERAKQNINKRWAKKDNKDEQIIPNTKNENTSAKKELYKLYNNNDTSLNTPSPTPTPIPSPYPTPSPNTFVSNDKIVFDSRFGEFKNITNELLEKWKETYPAINIIQEIKKAEAWLLANPKNKKKNYQRFLTNWFTRAQEKAPRVASSFYETQKFPEEPIVEEPEPEYPECWRCHCSGPNVMPYFEVQLRKHKRIICNSCVEKFGDQDDFKIINQLEIEAVI